MSTDIGDQEVSLGDFQKEFITCKGCGKFMKRVGSREYCDGCLE